MNERMKDYLRREVSTALEIMFRDNAALHMFDVDSERKFVFVMAVVPAEVVSKIEPFCNISAALRAETPVRRKTEDSTHEEILSSPHILA